MKLATIGYEKETQAAVIDRLRTAGVEVLIDVRAVPSSRRVAVRVPNTRSTIGDRSADATRSLCRIRRSL